jgi:hypothetical protein
VKIFYVVRDVSRNGSTQQVVAFFKSEALANQVAQVLSDGCTEAQFRTIYKDMKGSPRIATNKGVTIYACLNLWAGEMIVDSIHADSESAEKALNQGRGATAEYEVREVPLVGCDDRDIAE